MKIIVKAYGNDDFPPKLDGVLGALMLRTEYERGRRGVLPETVGPDVSFTMHGHAFSSQRRMAHELGVSRYKLGWWLSPQADDAARVELSAAIAKWDANDKRPLGEPQ